ncbi:MAG: metal-dependent hydrolase, partial [Gammaproteobacteria bacterium]
TSYGTHLLWPFSDERIAWSIIAIVDPVFTLLLLIPLIIGTRQCRPVFTRLALGMAAIYLLFAVSQSERAYDLAETTAASRGHTIDRLVVKPTLANLVLWRSVYESGGQIYVDAMHVGLSGTGRVYPGNSLPKLDPDRIDILPIDSRTMQDIHRFARFSDNWLSIHPEQPDLFGDIRYAMLPNSTIPLWGIRIDPEAPEMPPQFVTNRAFTAQMRHDFINMLRGKDLQD